jgi:curved DNA-binding protein CbpA
MRTIFYAARWQQTRRTLEYAKVLPPLHEREHHGRQQRAFSFSSGSAGSDNHQRRPFPHQIRSDNPYEVLGIHKSATYDEAKRRFFELALQHHPDTSKSIDPNNNTNDDRDKNVKAFIRFRQAFEALREGKDGMIYTSDEEDGSLWSSDEEFNAWFYEETGHSDIMFRMDIQTRKEVIDVVNNQAQGGLDRGGMWEMARKMAEQEEMLKDQKRKFKNPTIGLESSSSSELQNSSNVRRRRKRSS